MTSMSVAELPSLANTTASTSTSTSMPASPGSASPGLNGHKEVVTDAKPEVEVSLGDVKEEIASDPQVSQSR